MNQKDISIKSKDQFLSKSEKKKTYQILQEHITTEKQAKAQLRFSADRTLRVNYGYNTAEWISPRARNP